MFSRSADFAASERVSITKPDSFGDGTDIKDRSNKAAPPNRRRRFAFDMLRELEYDFLRSTFAVATVGEP